MEKRFEVRYTVTKERITERLRYGFFGRTVSKLMMILCAYIILNCILLAVCYNDYWFAAGGILITLFYCGLYVFRYFQSINLSYRRALEFNNGIEPVSNFSVNDNSISAHNNEETTTIPFENLKKAKLTKNYIFVHTKSKVVFAFPADSFILGDIYGMYDYLKSKGIKVK